MNGTSMAAPYVSGLASLLEILNPNLTISRIKEIILSSGDPLNSLRLKTTTGKRINAENALLSAMPIPPKLEISSIPSQENTTIAIISSTESTPDIMAGKISLKSSESDAVIKKLSFQYTVNDYDGILANESNIISAVKIYDGNTLLSTVAVTGATGKGEINFSGINIPIAKDTTKILTIKADFLKREKEGNNVIFSILKENTILEDKNSIITTNDNISGSYSSTKVYTYTKALTVTLVSTSIVATPDKANKEADATITFRVKAEGGDIYINDANDDTNNAMIYSVTNLGNESSNMSYTSDATHQGGYYTIKNGETKTITVSFHILSGDAGFYNVNLGKIK
jgi:subtilisin family serine protease